MEHVALPIVLIITGMLFGCCIVGCLAFWLSSMYKALGVSATCATILAYIMWAIGTGL